MEITCKNTEEFESAARVYCNNSTIKDIIKNMKNIIHVEYNSICEGELLLIQYLKGRCCIYINKEKDIVIRKDTEESEKMKLNELFKSALQ